MLQRPSFCLFFSAMLLLLHASLVMGAPTKGTITLVSSLDTKESMYGRWLKLIYQDAFARLGYDFIYAGYPGGRAPIWPKVARSMARYIVPPNINCKPATC